MILTAVTKTMQKQAQFILVVLRLEKAGTRHIN